MATPPNKNTAHTNSATAHAAIKTEADNRFISEAGDAILAAIAQGRFHVTLTSFQHCDLQVLHDYFVGLGYSVSYPGLGMLPGSNPEFFQPANLFGIFWVQFWAGANIPHLHNPAKVTISWRLP